MEDRKINEFSFYLEYNLQFFAKDGPGGEKTEEPTGKKLDDARKKGQVGKSQELVSAVSMLTTFVLLKMLMSFIGSNFHDTFHSVYTHIPEVGQTVAGREGVGPLVNNLFDYVLLKSLLITAPFLAITFLTALVMNMVQFKFKLTGEPLKPKFNKFSPVQGVKKIISKDSIMKLLFSLFKIGLIIAVIWNDIENVIALVLGMYGYTVMAGIGIIGNYVMNIAIKIAAFYLIVGFVDQVKGCNLNGYIH